MSERSEHVGRLSAAAPDHDVRAVLAIRPFRALWLCLGLSSLGDWLGLLATTALAARFGGQSSYAAANLAVSSVLLLRLAPAVLLGALAGAVADRWDRRATMVVGDLLRAGLFVSIPLVGTLWWLLVATLLIEVVALFWTPAKDASVPNLVPAHRLEAANQLSLAVTYGTAPLAALLFVGFSLITRMTPGAAPAAATSMESHVALALYADALTYLVAALVVARLKIPRGGQADTDSGAPPMPSWTRSILDGWRFVASTPLVRGLVLGMLGAFAAGGFVIGVAPTFVADLGGGEAGYGVLFGCVFTGLALGMWSGPRVMVALARWRLFALSLVAAGVLLVLTSLVGHLELVAIGTIGVGACGGVAWVTGYTLLGSEVDDDLRGRTFAFVQSLARIVLIAVIAAAPALAALIGEHARRLMGHDVVVRGSSVTLLIAGVVAGAIGVLAYRQLDDGSGASLREEVLRAWRRRHTATPEPPPRRSGGYFLAVEGGDGAGKSTQVRLLADWLESLGHDVVVTREPGATPLGASLRELLLHGVAGSVDSADLAPDDQSADDISPRAEALLYAADRAQHAERVIRPALEAGAFVLTDRYIDSSVAYQGAGRRLEADEVTRLSRWATSDLLPDLTVVLDLPAAAARGRLGSQLDRLERQSETFHEQVRGAFLDLARRAPRRYLVVDAGADAGQVQSAIRAALLPRLPATPAQAGEREQERARERAQLHADATARAARQARIRAARAGKVEMRAQQRDAQRRRRREAAEAAELDLRSRQARAAAEGEVRAARRADRHRRGDGSAETEQFPQQRAEVSTPAGTDEEDGW